MQEQLEQLKQQLIADLQRQLRESATRFLEGAQEDLDQYAFQIAESAVNAAFAGDAARLQELKAQVVGLAEINRLRMVGDLETYKDILMGGLLSLAFILVAGSSSFIQGLVEQLGNQS